MTERPAIHAETVIASDADELSARLRPIRGNVAIESGRGDHLDVRLASSLAGGAVTHQIQTTTGARFRFDSPFDGYALVLLHEGGLRARIGQQERTWLAGACAVLEATQVRQWQWQAGSYDVLLVGANDITQRLSALLDAPVTRPVTFQSEVSPESDGVRLGRAVMQMMQSCFGEDGSRATAMATAASIRDVAVGAFLEGLPHDYSDRLLGKTPGPSPRHVKSAIEFIHAYARDSILVEDIAKAAGVSVRALQVGFATFKNTTPMAYLKRVRLEGVRNELLHGDQASVAEVAMRWGFKYLGKFAKVYRDAFGELPSQTRRIARR
ncbi:helix-turn-helix transcriptional regulator [Cupriavidus basilensis]|uniref:Helix-turn-helix transcriptional regulator n=1 Tax=Cupriavidus basilensis TaxID=68895 RepID=A0ABT6ANI7_9BURK|nr:helix-turn-helix transcriptional regulator [Cupriavidus basilensis]MDF3834186.1 helix-turn-helix transcriptional regulator [Cupriavidus basilensis]